MKMCHMDLDSEDESTILEEIGELPVDYTVCDAHGRTALIHACIGNKLNIVRFVTSHHDEVKERDNEGNNVLVYAIKNGECDIIEHLLDCDRSSYELMSAQNNLGLTAFDFARRSKNKLIYKLLEDRIPSHPMVQDLRLKRSLPPAMIPPPTSGRQTFPYENDKDIPRVPFHHSKSWDVANDRIKKVHIYERGKSTGNFLSQSHDATAFSGMRMTANNDVSSMYRDSVNFSCYDRYAKHVVGNKLPQIATRTTEQKLDERKGRRDSVSLPDLRNIVGSLVSSGKHQLGSKVMLSSRESLAGSEDVFESDNENEGSLLKLPALNGRDSRKKEIALPGLARSRKTSTSLEDFIHKSVLL